MLKRFSQNLARVEADTADAIALDAAGNLYTAVHGLTDLEVRKYLPDGSVRYDHVIPLCGTGLVAITGLALDDAGHLWIAGNSTACLPLKGPALVSKIDEPHRLHGFLMKIDSNKTDDSALLYSTWIAAEPNQIRALRIDRGNAYLAGEKDTGQDSQTGFIAAVNLAPPALESSAPFPNTRINAIALDTLGSIYFTGRSIRSARGKSAPDLQTVVGALDSDLQLSYLARIADARLQEGRAISVPNTPGSPVLVAGVSDKGNFLLALHPCRNGSARIETARTGRGDELEIAWQPALDFSAASLPQTESFTWGAKARSPLLAVQTAPDCGAKRSR